MFNEELRHLRQTLNEVERRLTNVHEMIMTSEDMGYAELSRINRLELKGYHQIAGGIMLALDDDNLIALLSVDKDDDLQTKVFNRACQVIGENFELYKSGLNPDSRFIGSQKLYGLYLAYVVTGILSYGVWKDLTNGEFELAGW